MRCGRRALDLVADSRTGGADALSFAEQSSAVAGENLRSGRRAGALRTAGRIRPNGPRAADRN
ncbi:MAG: hypothetical protein BroJett031_19140 [Betaproteobacteria bacterium]|nr:MAG: hypothetical protein BroJett031_19140 [Betaproteobacteria bacterium]